MVEFEELAKKGAREIAYLAKGKRGVVYTAKYKGKKIAVKIKRKESVAKGRMENEAYWLQKLNKFGIGPKFLFSGENYLAYEFVDGEFITDFLKKSSKQQIISVLKSMFIQLYKMDMLKVNKEEMHHPVKHVIIDKTNTPVLIDFERCYKTEKAKNITQFCQFLISEHVSEVLQEKKILLNRKKLMDAAKAYKHEQTKSNLARILKLLNKD